MVFEWRQEIRHRQLLGMNREAGDRIVELAFSACDEQTASEEGLLRLTVEDKTQTARSQMDQMVKKDGGVTLEPVSGTVMAEEESFHRW